MIPVNNHEVAVECLDVTYRLNRRHLVDKLNFKVLQGEVLVLLGRSGSGKTTTMKLINNLLTPSSGEVLVMGKPTTQWDSIQLRRKIGYVIQEIGLFPHFTVEELLNLDPQHFAKRYPHQLSGGQRQRVGVARALAADPPLLLMDEPFGALDPITRLELQREFRQLQQQLGKTVIFVTHGIQEAFFLASKIGLMQDGRLVEFAAPDQFIKSQHPEARAFLESF
ncbi:MAG: ATP-binding cassette domain-containing protein [Oscillatoriales cyanobacterium]|nr:MAG: ATP-binding cassette domain-containing protein [Oscillatoriales cyanobacterium]